MFGIAFFRTLNTTWSLCRRERAAKCKLSAGGWSAGGRGGGGAKAAGSAGGRPSFGPCGRRGRHKRPPFQAPLGHGTGSEQGESFLQTRKAVETGRRMQPLWPLRRELSFCGSQSRPAPPSGAVAGAQPGPSPGTQPPPNLCSTPWLFFPPSWNPEPGNSTKPLAGDLSKAPQNPGWHPGDLPGTFAFAPEKLSRAGLPPQVSGCYTQSLLLGFLLSSVEAGAVSPSCWWSAQPGGRGARLGEGPGVGPLPHATPEVRSVRRAAVPAHPSGRLVPRRKTALFSPVSVTPQLSVPMLISGTSHAAFQREALEGMLSIFWYFMGIPACAGAARALGRLRLQGSGI